MISKKMENMVANSSAIRAMFEEGNRLAKIYGPENVFDFSLGNPNVPAPKAVKQAIDSKPVKTVEQTVDKLEKAGKSKTDSIPANFRTYHLYGLYRK